MKMRLACLAIVIAIALLVVGFLADDYIKLHEQVAYINIESHRNGAVKKQQESQPIMAISANAQNVAKNDSSKSSENAKEAYTFGMKRSDFAMNVFTFLIACFTGGILIIEVRGKRRELRAYVGVIEADISDWKVMKRPIARLVIRNTGHTPANNLEIVGFMAIAEFPLKSQGHLKSLVFADAPRTKMVLFPSADRDKEQTWERPQEERDLPLTADEIGELDAGEKAIYVWGCITYRDAFGSRRSTDYLYFSNGKSVERRDFKLIAYSEGNKAT